MVLLWAVLAGVSAATTVDGAIALQHRSLATQLFERATVRAAGPALSLRVSDAHSEVAVDLAMSGGPQSSRLWEGAVVQSSHHKWGPMVVGHDWDVQARVGHPCWSMGQVSFAPSIGLDVPLRTSRVRVMASTPLLGLAALPGTLSTDPRYIPFDVSVPVVVAPTGPWNTLGVDVVGRWVVDVPAGQLVVAVKTSLDRLDIGDIERKVTTVTPSVGWRWGGRSSGSTHDAPTPDDVPPLIDEIAVPPLPPAPPEPPAPDDAPPEPPEAPAAPSSTPT